MPTKKKRLKSYGDPVYSLRLPVPVRRKCDEVAKLAGFESFSDYNRQLLVAMNEDYPAGVYAIMSRLAVARAQMRLPFDSEPLNPPVVAGVGGAHAERAE